MDHFYLPVSLSSSLSFFALSPPPLSSSTLSLTPTLFLSLPLAPSTYKCCNFLGSGNTQSIINSSDSNRTLGKAEEWSREGAFSENEEIEGKDTWDTGEMPRSQRYQRWPVEREQYVSLMEFPTYDKDPIVD